MSDCCHIEEEPKDQHPNDCCEPAGSQRKFRLGKKLKIWSGIFILIYGLSYLPYFEKLNHSLNMYIGEIWWAMVLGIFIGGLIDYFVPDNFIYRFLGGGKKRNLLNAVLAGFLLSACSHGMLAIAMQLYKKGAGVPAVMTFLLASPWANLPITFLLFGFFGWQAIFIVLAAMVIALTTGLLFMGLQKLDWIEGPGIPELGGLNAWRKWNEIDWNDAAKGVAYGSLKLANMVLWWTFIGFLMAAAISAYVPAEWITQYFSADFKGMLLTLAGASVIEVCSEGSAPIAFELHKQLGVLGNPFIFLMAGVVTDYTEIGLVWTTIGRRSAIWLPVLAVPQVIFFAWLMNHFL